MSTLQLPDQPRLSDFQAYVRQMEQERGFDTETLTDKFMLFLEECGEMARSARKAVAKEIRPGKELADVEHEVADVFIYLLEICNRLNVDLESAFRAKEKINSQRVWRKVA